MHKPFEQINCLVIGYGSIGKRHAELLEQLGANITIVSNQTSLPFPVQKNLKEAIYSDNKINYAVISNQTDQHFNSLKTILDTGYSGRILVEKPLFSQPQVDLAAGNAVIGVGYNLRFHPALSELKTRLAKHTILSAQIYCGSYLPDWRPDQDYRQVASSTCVNSGGVTRELSHELDYITWLLGKLKINSVIRGHVSQLEMKADDILLLTAATPHCPVVSIQLNFFDRIGHREIRVNTDSSSFVVDLKNHSLRENNDIINYNIHKNFTYGEMHKALLKADMAVICDLPQGYQIVKTIDEIISTQPSTPSGHA